MIFEYAMVFAFGSVIGSFLNVVIHRVPLGQSIAFPPSHCPHCDRKIKPHENIPIISYVSLKGRCKGCKEKISLRYPVIETLMGLSGMLMLFYFGWTWNSLLYGILAAFLIALSAIDIEIYRLPNSITLTGAITAIVFTLVFLPDRIFTCLLGGVVGVGLLLFMWLVGRLLFRKETLGMGDIKLAGMIGLFIGPWHSIGMFVFGVFLGAIIGVSMIAAGGLKKGQKIPFGPYLALGAVTSLFWGKKILGWYLSFSFR